MLLELQFLCLHRLPTKLFRLLNISRKRRRFSDQRNGWCHCNHAYYVQRNFVRYPHSFDLVPLLFLFVTTVKYVLKNKIQDFTVTTKAFFLIKLYPTCKWITDQVVQNDLETSSTSNQRNCSRDGELVNQIKIIRKEKKLFSLAFFPLLGIAIHPTLVISISLWVVVILGYGAFNLNVTTDPNEIWASPNSRSRQEKDYFDTRYLNSKSTFLFNTNLSHLENSNRNLKFLKC